MNGEEAGPSKKPGILRVDLGKRISSASVEFKENIIEPASPQPSVDRLSVSFANEDKKQEEVKVIKEFIPETREDEDDGDLDEYSASASAILEKGKGDNWRRRSSKRRRSSSPLSISLRRRSSVFTTSSGDTAISMEDDNQEQIFQNMRIHKEVVAHIKYQAWPIQRKLRLVQEAKSYIKQHEGQIQERLAQRTSIKDILAHTNILMINNWNFVKREIINLSNNMIPWEPRIKQIESHFGSVVASYFTFLRWLFSVNVIITVVLIVFLAIPEILFGNKGKSGDRKIIPEEELPKSRDFLTLWNFEGALKYSPIFYGFYNSENENNNIFGNKLPLIYFMVSLGVYAYSFVAILRKMAVNSRQSKLSEKDDDCIFTWKMFTSWDFMIGNPETAHNRTASIILGFKEALLEEAEKTREEGRNWKLLSIRIFTHFNVIWLLASSMYAVILVVGRSEDTGQKETGWWRQNEVTVVITLIGTIYPILFDGISYLEKYHPRKALRLQLARIMVLNLLNLYSFIFATFSVIHRKSVRLTELKEILIKTMNKTDTSSKRAKRSISPNYPSVIAKSITVGASILANVISDTGGNHVGNSTDLHVLPTNSSISNYTTYSENTKTLLTLQQLIGIPDYFFNVSSTESPLENSSFYRNYYEDETETLWDEEGTLSPNQINRTCLFDCDSINNNSVVFLSTDMGNQTTQELLTSEINENNYTSTKEINTISTFPYNHTSSTESACKDGCIDIVTSSGERNISDGNATSPPFICTTQVDSPRTDLSLQTKNLDTKSRKELHNLCWETMFGQELVKLTVMDLFMTVFGIIMGDFVRALFVRFMNSCWCWDLEKKFPQYADFKIAENILHLVNNQGMVWMGMFFSPGLPLINLLKLVVMMYFRSWAVLTCNIPHEVVFRASRSNNFYFGLLLTMLFLCVLPVGYALVWIEPSWHCGPFSNYNKIYHLFTSSLKKLIPGEGFKRVLEYIASPGIVIPLLMLLVLIIFYLLSLTSALREANDDLKIQLRRERTEERRKMFQIANKKRRGTEVDTPFHKWCNIINANSLRKISLDNVTNNIKLDKNQLKRITNHIEEEEQCEINVKESNRHQPKDKMNLEKNRKREDSVASNKSIDNIPEIKISKTDSMENVLDHERETKRSSTQNSKETITKIIETTDELNDDVFLENENLPKSIT